MGNDPDVTIYSFGICNVCKRPSALENGVCPECQPKIKPKMPDMFKDLFGGIFNNGN